MTTTQHTIIESARPPRKSSRRRFAAVSLAATTLLGLLLARSFYLQILRGADFLSQAEANRVDRIPVPAPRGIIYDRNNEQLVENISNTDLILDPSLIPNEENEAQLIENLLRVLPHPDTDTIAQAFTKVRKTRQPTLLVKALDHDSVLQIEESMDTIVGVRLVSTLVRKYSFSFSLAHVIGYTSPVTEEEIAQNSLLSLTDSTGKQGVEKTYEEQLRGKQGYRYLEVNAQGRPQTDLGTQEPQAGKDVTLTLDAKLQKFIYDELFDRREEDSPENESKRKGAAIVLEPITGSIVAMVSYPSFDPNIFSQPSLRTDTHHLFADERKPLFNRATDGTYPTGSIIKPFLAAAALEEGTITESTTITSSGGITIGPWHFSDWKEGGHGVTDVKKAIAESVNTFFYIAIGGDSTHEGLGVAKAARYLNYFGWSKRTGIDLPTESKGFLPSPEWKEQTFGERWYVGDSYHFSIGQGNVLATPLQIAVATAAIADGGVIRQPHIADMKMKAERLPISAKNIEIVKAGMRQAVTEGSSRALSMMPIAIAGKTGTAQIGGSDKTHAWFTSFGPYENPQLVVTVLLEEGGEGEKDAIPIAKEIWRWWIEKRLQKAETQ